MKPANSKPDAPRRRPGAPKGNQNGRKANPLNATLPPVRCREGERKAAERAAEAEGLTLGGWLRRIVRDTLNLDQTEK